MLAFMLHLKAKPLSLTGHIIHTMPGVTSLAEAFCFWPIVFPDNCRIPASKWRLFCPIQPKPVMYCCLSCLPKPTGHSKKPDGH